MLKLKLKVYTSRILEVKAANGESIWTMGVCFEAYIFVDDLNVLFLGGYDVVMGSSWLSTLGEILWDFMAIMYFILAGE